MPPDIVIQLWKHAMRKEESTSKRGWNVRIIDVLFENRQYLRAIEHHDLFCCIWIDPRLRVFPDRGEIRGSIAYLIKLMLIWEQTQSDQVLPTKTRRMVSG